MRKILAALALSITILLPTAPAALSAPLPAPTTVGVQVHVKSDPERQWAVQRPSRGGASRWRDSNVPAVWRGVPTWIRSVGLCIRLHESIMAGHYKAHNGRSSAAGAYQFLDGTWRGNAKWTKVNGKFVARQYRAANHAPAWIQDAVFIHSVRHGGLPNWVGTGCPGTG